MNKKFIQAIACLLFFALTLGVYPYGHAFSSSSDSDNGYNDPVIRSFGFSAELDDGDVSMTWNAYAPSGFNYYKIIRSTENSDPVYPEDGYIKYSTNTDFTSYLDTDVPEGTVYYRVCSIAYPDRYCSKVVTIRGDESTESDTEESDTETSSETKDEAEEESVSDNGYNDPVIRSFGLTAELDDGDVTMTWNSYNPSGFDYYKIIRSTENSDPVYPEDGYIKVSTNPDFSSYIDADAPEGTLYYRICAIAYPDRYCSEVVTISNGTADETSDDTSDEEESDTEDETSKTYTVSKAESEFSDSVSHQYNTAIEYLRENAIVSGYDDGTYKPDNEINRAEFMKIVMGASYPTELSEGVEGYCFSDVAMDWYAPYVCLAKEKSIVSGYDDGNFRPAQNISFVEAAKILAEVYGLDAEAGEQWYEGYVKALQNENYIPSTVNSLSKSITRAEMAELIWRIKEQVKDQSTVELLTEAEVIDTSEKDGWTTYYGDGFTFQHPNWYQGEKWGWDILTDELDYYQNLNTSNYMDVDSYLAVYTTSGSDLNATVWFDHPLVSSTELTINGVSALKRCYRAASGTTVNGRTTGENENITVYTYQLDGKVAVLQYFNAYGTENYNVETFYEIANSFAIQD